MSDAESLLNVERFQKMLDTADSDPTAEKFLREWFGGRMLDYDVPIQLVVSLGKVTIAWRREELKYEAGNN